MSCRNCGHSAEKHPEGLHCEHATETSRERSECACPAYNVRPRVIRPQLSDTERAHIAQAEINDLDRQIGALQQRRAAAVRLLETFTAQQTA